ncbi:MAG TPA: DNA polymerase III subunit gamma/tau, partial [Psychrobacter sp.]|nr:DNA polymerase III subunit gamma/tau [Psychrobacter sp.]
AFRPLPVDEVLTDNYGNNMASIAAAESVPNAMTHEASAPLEAYDVDYHPQPLDEPQSTIDDNDVTLSAATGPEPIVEPEP